LVERLLIAGVEQLQELRRELLLDVRSQVEYTIDRERGGEAVLVRRCKGREHTAERDSDERDLLGIDIRAGVQVVDDGRHHVPPIGNEALALLPHLRTKPSALVINVSSVLGFIPFSIINPVYNGTKAWLHFWSMNLRTQLAQAGCNVRVVEIAPPMVESDLHREREDPDDNKKKNNSMALTMEEFIEETAAKLERGDDMIGVGTGEGIVGKWYDAFGERYGQASGGK